MTAFRFGIYQGGFVMSCSRLGWVSVVLFVLSGTSTVSAQETKAAPRRPNILWITTHDINPDLGCYAGVWPGAEYATTPELDRLAAEGVRFDNAFATTPVCAPSRAAILMGTYPTASGALPLAVAPKSISSESCPRVMER